MRKHGEEKKKIIIMWSKKAARSEGKINKFYYAEIKRDSSKLKALEGRRWCAYREAFYSSGSGNFLSSVFCLQSLRRLKWKQLSYTILSLIEMYLCSSCVWFIIQWRSAMMSYTADKRPYLCFISIIIYKLLHWLQKNLKWLQTSRNHLFYTMNWAT